MSALQIKKAVRQAVWLKIAVTGPSGSGKTKGGLRLAFGLASPGGRVALIDTENESASLYADEFDFDTIPLSAPFTPQRYTEALGLILEAGYQVVVIDSISHEWAHAGGILDTKSQKDARGGNGYTNWMDMKRVHQQFVDTLLQSKIHVISTVRSKTEYVLETNEKGKQVPRKVGLGLVQAPELEYEFSVVFDVERETHLSNASKDRTGLFEGRSFMLSEEIGREMRAWRDSGAALAPVSELPPPDLSAPKPEEDPEGYKKAFGQMCKDVLDEKQAARKDQQHPDHVNEFVDGLTPLKRGDSALTESVEPEEIITKKDYEALNAALALFPETATPEFRKDLRAYCAIEGQLAPGANGPTLARWRKEPYSRFMAALGNDEVRPGMVKTIITPF